MRLQWSRGMRPTVWAVFLGPVVVFAGNGCESENLQEKADQLRGQLATVSVDEAKAGRFLAQEYEDLLGHRGNADSAYAAGDYAAAAAGYAGALERRQVFAAHLDRLAWVCTFGGEEAEQARSVQQTPDGGYIVAGQTTSFGEGGRDVYFLKIDALGNEEWRRTFGGENRDWANSVRVAPDGGYVFVGRTGSFGDWAGDVYLIKTDGEGNEQWRRTFGGGGTDSGEEVQVTTDGGYIIAGGTFQKGGGKNVYLIKIDAQGKDQWQRIIGGEEDEWAQCVQQTADDGYIVAGGIGSLNENRADILLLKTDPEGNELWRVRLDGGGATDLGALSMRVTPDGGYILAAETADLGDHEDDVLLIRADAEGKEMWRRTFGGARREAPWSVRITPDGGYIVAGVTQSFGAGGEDVYLIKTDETGQEEWSRTIGGGSDEAASAIECTRDGGYIIAGGTSPGGAGKSDVYLVKTDAEGYSWSAGRPVGSTELVAVATPSRVPPGPLRAPVAEEVGPKVGDRAPEVLAEAWLNASAEVNLTTLRGNLVVVAFWATWCGLDDESFPALNELYAKYRGRGLVVIGLTDEDRVADKVDAFVNQLGIEYIVGTGSRSDVTYGVRGLPEAVLVDAEGTVLWRGHPTMGLGQAVAKEYEE